MENPRRKSAGKRPRSSPAQGLRGSHASLVAKFPLVATQRPSKGRSRSAARAGRPYSAPDAMCLPPSDPAQAALAAIRRVRNHCRQENTRQRSASAGEQRSASAGGQRTARAGGLQEFLKVTQERVAARAGEANRRQLQLKQENARQRSASAEDVQEFLKMTRSRVAARATAVAAVSVAAEQTVPQHDYIVPAESIRLAAEFDEAMRAAGVFRILALGDCHASRTVCLLSNLYCSHFHGGCIFSWTSGKRELPPLQSLCPPGIGASRHLVLVLSYGEIDCRCHSSKFIGRPEMLSEPYVCKVLKYVGEFNECIPRVHVVPILLAVPPATDQGHNPHAPFRDDLSLRIEATSQLNAALELACMRHGMAFTGADTWDFVKCPSGALCRDLSDGHVHIDARFCGPVLERLRRLIHEAAV